MPVTFSPAQCAANDTLASGSRFVCLFGGARSGKTFLIVRAIILRALKAPGSRHLIARFRQNAVWTSIVGDSNATLFVVADRCFNGLKFGSHRQDGYFELPNGSTIWLGGLDDKERVDKILGREYSTVYLNEASEIPYSSIIVALTRLAEKLPGFMYPGDEGYDDAPNKKRYSQRAFIDLNPIGKTHWTNRMFNEHRDPVSMQSHPNPAQFACARLNPIDNVHNLSPEFMAYLETLPEKQRKRFLEGEYTDEVEGALWTWETLDACRVAEDYLNQDTSPLMQRVVVAVDPSGCRGDDDTRSDEIGISVCGLGSDGVAYVLADYTCRLPPEKWAERVLYAWAKHKADKVVAEKNFGGDMVRAVIESQATARGVLGVKVELVNADASRGKIVRAEPVAALYSANPPKIRHVGRFPELEDQLISFSSAGYMGEKSPDRADAMIWAMWDLIVEDQDFSGLWARFGAALN